MAWGLFDKLFKRSSSQVNIKLYFFFFVESFILYNKKKTTISASNGIGEREKKYESSDSEAQIEHEHRVK